jgi:hypothetical protein
LLGPAWHADAAPGEGRGEGRIALEAALAGAAAPPHDAAAIEPPGFATDSELDRRAAVRGQLDRVEPLKLRNGRRVAPGAAAVGGAIADRELDLGGIVIVVRGDRPIDCLRNLGLAVALRGRGEQDGRSDGEDLP